MANEKQLSILKRGVKVWNKWRDENPDVEIDLKESDLFQTDFRGVNLRGANLTKTNLFQSNLLRANLRETRLGGAILFQARLKNADLTDAHIDDANLFEADLRNASLFGVNLTRANLFKADFRNAKVLGATFDWANLFGADLSSLDLSGVEFRGANLSNASLNDTNLTGADLFESNLTEANLKNANLTGANLSHSSLIKAVVANATISNSRVYGVNVWDLLGDFREQQELIITPEEESAVTVDNIKVAQFIYLILKNKEIRGVINTLTSKTVLILGSFSRERKPVLDALRNKLREYDLLPIMFDFDRPIDRNTVETIQTLAGLSYFIIADVSSPKQSPLELQATLPDLMVPCVPIIQEGEIPFFAMMEGLKQRDWVLDTISYDTLETLMEILKPHIIDPAIKKHDQLRLIKAKVATVISGRELKEKK